MKDRLLQLLAPLILLGGWELLARLGLIDVRFYSSPAEVLTRLVQIVGDGTLGRAIGSTLWRMLFGFVLAAVPGVLVGMLMGLFRPLRLALTPLVSGIYPVPKIALVPLVILIFGINDTAKIAVVVISVFFMVAVSTVSGVLNIDPRYFDIARNNGARGWNVLSTVALPAALPGILTGLNLALGFALTVMVGTELIQPQDGLGGLLNQGARNFDVPLTWAVILVVALLGFLLTLGMDWLESELVPWRPRPAMLRPPTPPAANEPRLRRFVRIWWMATRPWSFGASMTPVLLGCAIAVHDGFFSLTALAYGALALLGSVAIHAGTNLINDYYDWRKGTDTPQSLGPNRALSSGLITPGQMFWAALICFGLGSCIGLYLAWARGPLILWIGIFSVLAGWFYTAGPAAFAYIGLGEVIVFVFMGPLLVLGAYYCMVQQAPIHPMLIAIPAGLWVANILHANNMRDFPEDLRNNKRTLANILGRRASKIEFWLLSVGPFAVLILLLVFGVVQWPLLITLFALPWAWRLARRATATEAVPVLNLAVRDSAALHKNALWLMIAGMLLARLLPR